MNEPEDGTLPVTDLKLIWALRSARAHLMGGSPWIPAACFKGSPDLQPLLLAFIESMLPPETHPETPAAPTTETAPCPHRITRDITDLDGRVDQDHRHCIGCGEIVRVSVSYPAE